MVGVVGCGDDVCMEMWGSAQEVGVNPQYPQQFEHWFRVLEQFYFIYFINFVCIY